MVNSPKIEIRNLYKIFGSDPTAALDRVKAGMGKEELLHETGHVLGLQDISIDINESAITVVMGLSGSGKSTLIRHINRLIEPTDGQVLIDGEDALLLDKDALRDKRRTDMSMVFQKFALLPHRTVIDNSALPLEVRGVAQSERHKEAQVWINRVGLGGFEKHYPYQLSGGMQQRVGLARALTSNSDIMLMDEAFSALDPLIRSDMQKLLLELHVELKKTIVFITHDLDEALRLADHLVILKDGAVIQQGDPQNILVNPSDPYIEAFVSDINRARVLRVRSVMTPLNKKSKYVGDVGPSDTLESLIARAEGDTSFKFRVVEEEKPIGQIDMKDLVKALVPRVSAVGQQNL
jgi:glycine betaine/proline transport system ATP-binding protein|tara:strand:+ start:2156 stop:3205 length:1050 start_codon:yes stop_codon:yes gene_type:complete